MSMICGPLVAGISNRETAEALKDEFNDLDRKAMIEVADAYDINVPAHENDAYVAKVRSVIDEWEPAFKERMAEILKKGAPKS